MAQGRIIHIELDEATILWRNADIEQERRIAIFDLIEDNTFKRNNAPDPHKYVPTSFDATPPADALTTIAKKLQLTLRRIERAIEQPVNRVCLIRRRRRATAGARQALREGGGPSSSLAERTCWQPSLSFAVRASRRSVTVASVFWEIGRAHV